jgi:hypothetical protein
MMSFCTRRFVLRLRYSKSHPSVTHMSTPQANHVERLKLAMMVLYLEPQISDFECGVRCRQSGSLITTNMDDVPRCASGAISISRDRYHEHDSLQTFQRHGSPLHLFNSIFTRVRERRPIVSQCLNLDRRFDQRTAYHTTSRPSGPGSHVQPRATVFVLGVPHAQLLLGAWPLQSRK